MRRFYKQLSIFLISVCTTVVVVAFTMVNAGPIPPMAIPSLIRVFGGLALLVLAGGGLYFWVQWRAIRPSSQTAHLYRQATQPEALSEEPLFMRIDATFGTDYFKEGLRLVASPRGWGAVGPLGYYLIALVGIWVVAAIFFSQSPGERLRGVAYPLVFVALYLIIRRVMRNLPRNPQKTGVQYFYFYNTYMYVRHENPRGKAAHIVPFGLVTGLTESRYGYVFKVKKLGGFFLPREAIPPESFPALQDYLMTRFMDVYQRV